MDDWASNDSGKARKSNMMSFLMYDMRFSVLYLLNYV